MQNRAGRADRPRQVAWTDCGRPIARAQRDHREADGWVRRGRGVGTVDAGGQRGLYPADDQARPRAPPDP